MRKSVYVMLILGVLLSSFVILGLAGNGANAATCTVTLLWQFPNSGDNDATQAPPRDLHFGETVTVKAQFRDCQGSGNQAAMVVYGTKDLSAIFFPLNLIGVAVSAKVGPQDISTNFVELSQAVSFASPGGNFAFQAAAYNGNTILARKTSQALVVNSVSPTPTPSGGNSAFCLALKGAYDNETNQAIKDSIKNQATQQGCTWVTGGDCTQSGAGWINYTCPGGQKVCLNINTNQTKAVPGVSGGPTSCSGGGGTTSSGVFDIENPIAADDFATLINIIARWIFNLAIPIAIIMIIYAGIKMLIAQDSGAFNKARDILKYAVIGLVVIFIGKGFISLVKSILNLGS